MNSEANKYELITDTKTRQAEFLFDTLKHFNRSNRGVKRYSMLTGTCSYVAGCAIGRHLNAGLARVLDDLENPSVNHPDCFRKLPDYMKDMGTNFLTGVQRLHDAKSCWTDYGFNPDCRKDAENIIEVFGLDLKLKYTDTGVVRANEVNSVAV